MESEREDPGEWLLVAQFFSSVLICSNRSLFEETTQTIETDDVIS